MFSNILIVKLSAIGDVVHALPVAHALKTCYPQARITWVVEKAAYDILVNNPTIDEILIFDKPKYKSLAGFAKHAPAFVQELRSRKFDLALDLQGLFKSAAIAWLSGAPVRCVYQNAREGSDLLARKVVGPNAKGHVVEQYLDVVRQIGCHVSRVSFPIEIAEEEKDTATAIACQAGLDLNTPYVILSPGANWPNKCWPPAHFAKLAADLRSCGITPLLTGGPSDLPKAAEIRRLAKASLVDITGKTTLKQLAYLIKRAQVFVGGDTGPMHLAAALGTPVVALHGPTDTIRNGPYGAQHTTIVAAQECAGCWKRRCPKDRDCLAVINPNQVFETVRKYLNTALPCSGGE